MGSSWSKKPQLIQEYKTLFENLVTKLIELSLILKDF